MNRTFTAPNPAADTAAMCDGKDRLTFDQAKRIAARMTSKERVVSPYKCPACRRWHVGQPAVMGRQ